MTDIQRSGGKLFSHWRKIGGSGLILLLLLCCLLGGCASKSERYEAALDLFENGQYAEAEKAFKKLKGYEEADALREKSALLLSWQDEKAGKDFVSAWVSRIKKSYSGLIGKSFSSMNMKEKQNVLQNPERFTDWAIGYAEGKGDREIFFAAYPYIRDACRGEEYMAFFGSKLDEYIAETAALTELYRENPALFKIAEKYGWIRFGSNQPVNQSFARWIEENPESPELIGRLMKYVEESQTAELKHMIWTDERLEEYFGSKTYQPAHPEKNTVLLVTAGENTETYLSAQRTLIPKAAPGLQVTEDPDAAAVYIYRCLTRNTETYIRKDGRGTRSVHEGTVEYRAVDAATGAEIASVSYQGKAPSQVYGENRDDRVFDPDEKNLDTDTAFLAFLKKIEEYWRTNP